jgi:mannose-6-phosphate isomerase-like protein (cupin superfamily)
MDPRFGDIFTKPENQIFYVVFYPDRVYHAKYLNATRSARYRYNVREVRHQHDIAVLKGEVYMNGKFLTNFMRIEYSASRLVELVREKLRFLRREISVRVKLLPEDATKTAEASFKMRFCPWIDAYQVEVWETLEPLEGLQHDFQVLDLLGRDNSITRIPSFNPALRDLAGLRRVELSFREADRDLPYGYQIHNRQVDNNFLRSHQERRSSEPSASINTVPDQNYLIDFQRGFYLEAQSVDPVCYRNAMMNQSGPECSPENIIEMRWILQRELGSSLVFFHEVTIPPGKIEGTHRHIGTEELYYITEGEGVAYMADGDDPKTSTFPLVERDIFGIGPKMCRELPVRPGNVIFTKSGGIHGISNAQGSVPLKFVAFLYHTS